MSTPNPERLCAFCGKPQDAAYRPFCSKRCADLDLGRWLKGEYVIEDGTVSSGKADGTEPDD